MKFKPGIVLAAAIAASSGCGSSDTQLTKEEVKNFKGSKEMSEEAKKRMAEGLKRMGEIQRSNGKTSAPPSGGNG